MTFPRVPGIEASGVVAACPGGESRSASRSTVMMGGMGRQYDGGYAEYTCVPVRQAVPFRSDLPWSTLGAVPEMLQTAYGSLTVGYRRPARTDPPGPGQHVQCRDGGHGARQAGGPARHLDDPRLPQRRPPARARRRPRAGRRRPARR